MKEQKLYLCEYCGTQYKDKKKAMQCEEHHKLAKEVKNASYHAGCDFPDRMEVEFTDGTRCWYKR